MLSFDYSGYGLSNVSLTQIFSDYEIIINCSKNIIFPWIIWF